MNLGLKMAFEAAYPPKHPDHRDLIEVDFVEFVCSCVGEEMFARLSDAIHGIQELVGKDCFRAYFDAGLQQLKANRVVPPADTSLFQEADFNREEVPDISENPCFKSIVTTAWGFDVLWWLFEERQDILATFVRQLTLPMAEMHPSVFRVRARRE